MPKRPRAAKPEQSNQGDAYDPSWGRVALSQDDRLQWQRDFEAGYLHAPSCLRPVELALLLSPPVTETHRSILNLALTDGIEELARRVFPRPGEEPPSPFAAPWYQNAQAVEWAVQKGDLPWDGKREAIPALPAYRWAHARGFSIPPEWVAEAAMPSVEQPSAPGEEQGDVTLDSDLDWRVLECLAAPRATSEPWSASGVREWVKRCRNLDYSATAIKESLARLEDRGFAAKAVEGKRSGRRGTWGITRAGVKALETRPKAT